MTRPTRNVHIFCSNAFNFDFIFNSVYFLRNDSIQCIYTFSYRLRINALLLISLLCFHAIYVRKSVVNFEPELTDPFNLLINVKLRMLCN